MESILISTKKISGLTAMYDAFDTDLIMYINSVFLGLKQMGIGPKDGFFIEDDTSVWTDFIPDGTPAENILRESTKAYMGHKAQMHFDPPSNATLNETLQRNIDEFEYRGRLEAELIADGKEENQNG